MSILKVCALFVLLALTACGKYGPPLPPERLAPKPVQQLVVKGGAEGVKISWDAPERDIRGKALQSLDGFRVYRAQFAPGFTTKIDDFTLLGTLEDRSVSGLLKKQEEAKAQGKSLRRVSIDAALKHYEYLDGAVSQGLTYLYRIIPVNQEGGEGKARELIKVTFKGDLSEIGLIPDVVDEDAGNDLF